MVCNRCGKERDNYGNKMCKPCYQHIWSITNSKIGICKKCLKEKRLYSKQLCKNCYMRKWKHTPKGIICEKKHKINYNNDPKRVIKTKSRMETNKHNKRTRICQDCKKETKTQFHHISYNPNITVELCIDCHNLRHRKNNNI